MLNQTSQCIQAIRMNFWSEGEIRCVGMTTTSSVDKYETVEDIQNDCISFYLNRVKATENLKQKLENKNGGREPKKTSMSMAMDRLRLEMTSLVDQDLSLMRQLLTLNETIEEIKNKRLYGVSKDSLYDSEDYLKGSTCHLSKSVSTMSLGSDYFCECSGSEDDTDLTKKDLDSEDSGYGK
ncbi:Hypothetical predicted protein [Mytilus galloprovincialis]|uniref:Uncharacterized protein n=1 Tax=Mytilus galloprovincialis TaxID=29158 RepID=A0A8B6CNV7_MYTGA|nr:Hypothetical predicted protein [Mytilus galloprovincialis]